MFDILGLYVDQEVMMGFWLVTCYGYVAYANCNGPMRKHIARM